MNLQSKKIIKHLVLVILFSSFLWASNFQYNNNNYDTQNLVNNHLENENTSNLKSQDISDSNQYNGIGEPWNVTHYANRTDSNLNIQFGNGTYDLAQIPLGSGWQGYKLESNIYDLYDTRNWNNGTFDFGSMDAYNSGDDDDHLTSDNAFQNWTFDSEDYGSSTNEMSGNYINSTYTEGDGHNAIELRMDGADDGGNYHYDTGDICYWNSSIEIPRGRLIDSQLNYEVNPNYLANFNSWELAFSINEIKIYSIGSYSLKEYGEGSWHSFSIPQGLWTNTTNVYPSILNDSSLDLEVSLEYTADSATYASSFTHIEYQQLFIDNVDLEVKSEVKPSQIQLQQNETAVDDLDWGEGEIELEGDWQGEQVTSNFSCKDTWELSEFQIDLDTDLNLYAIKHSPNTNYATDTESLGTNFEISNESKAEWEFYAYFSVPSGYEEDEMILEFPSDINITWVSEPQDPSKNRLGNCDNSTDGKLLVDVSAISTTPDGFWNFKAESPNYCKDLRIYKNKAGEWLQDNEFISGESINITAGIEDSELVSTYLEQTHAKLSIRFPNGTIWNEQTQYISPNSNGLVDFDTFQIPSNPPNYEVGEYEAIVTWNNSYGDFGLNETGIISNTFTVIHNSTLTPESVYYEDVTEDSTINIRVEFQDLENDEPIRDADIYTNNFTHPNKKEVFGEIGTAPGVYQLEFNVSGAEAGNNTITIYANSSQYINQEIEITIGVNLETALTSDKEALNVIWNENFTVQLNYTELTTEDGIDAELAHNWDGNTHTTQISTGVYNLTCNTSLYQVNQIHNLDIELDEFGYEAQELRVRVDVEERPTSLTDIELNQTIQDSITFPHNEVLDIRANFTDELSDTFIDSAEIRLEKGSEILGSFSKVDTENLYHLSINTKNLDLGLNSLVITAKQTNYSKSSRGITVYVQERDTYYHQLFLDGMDKTEKRSITLPWNEDLPVSVVINDSISDEFISEINNLQLTGQNISVTLTEENGNYTGIIEAGELPVGTTRLTISGTKENYTINSLEISVSGNCSPTKICRTWSAVNDDSKSSIIFYF
ncbi:MAG: hypothetical protein R6U96_11360, partial [Promethearchaeia archaeon]